jgi:cytochrome bd ubiquinol oxidase subunit II
VFLGAALGNVVRGVPLDASGYFFEPLWTNFELGDNTGILDWYTTIVGVTALVVLMMHGSLWVQLKTDGAVRARASKIASWTWWGVLILTGLLTMITFSVQPQIMANFKTWPVGFILPAIAIAGLAGVQFELRRGKELNAFLASCGYLLGMLTSVVFGVYPMVLPARNAAYSLTVSNAKAGDYGLKVGVIWWIIGMLLASGYFFYVYRTFAGKISANSDTYPHNE